MKKIYILIYSVFYFAGTGNAQYTKLLDFAGASNGGNPYGSLFSDGAFLYGMTQEDGTIFKIKPDGTGYVKLFDFSASVNGFYPGNSLISDGNYLYGMTSQGGANYGGTIFKIKSDGTGYVKLLDFAGATDGRTPRGSLISDGTFLYGLTFYGGTNNLGTIFKIMPNGTGYVKLLDFTGSANGSRPDGSFISDGTFLYGMTGYGGTNDLGTIFKIKPDGTGYVKLFDFSGGVNGYFPHGTLISDGTFLYGMTEYGGTNNLGTIFKIKSDGTGYVKLFDFSGVVNGSNPTNNSLIFDGTFLYGMTTYGGTSTNCTDGCGTIFKIKPDGTGYVKFLDFTGSANGSLPKGSLISDGIFLYGITQTGGINDKGVIFKYQFACSPINFSQSPTICSGQSIMVGSNNYTASGTYTDTLAAVNGCDSIVTTHLTVTPLPNVTTQLNGATITANQSGATYQWVNCNNNYSLIAGATNQSYIVTANGSYAVIVTLNNCSDTSVCVNVTTIGINETGVSDDQLLVFPNPTNGAVVINFKTQVKGNQFSITIKNELGATVYSENKKVFSGEYLKTIDLSHQSKGVYFVEIVFVEEKISGKFVLE